MNYLQKTLSLLLVVFLLLTPALSVVATDWKLDSSSEQRKFAGHEYDQETDLPYMNARYYNGKAGRFVSVDPLVLKTPEKIIQDPQALNSYAYARNNPLVYVDNTGEFFETAWDIANVAYDAGRLVKNTAEIGIGAAKYGYGALTNNQSLRTNSVNGMKSDFGDLASAGIDTIFDTGATFIPFVPAGVTKVGGKVGDAGEIVKKVNDNKSIFTKAAEHSEAWNHYPDKSIQEIEDIARNTYNNFDIKVNIKGVKKYFYNSKTNDLFINNPKQPTVFSPGRGLQYLKDAVKKDIGKGGRVK